MVIMVIMVITVLSLMQLYSAAPAKTFFCGVGSTVSIFLVSIGYDSNFLDFSLCRFGVTEAMDTTSRASASDSWKKMIRITRHQLPYLRLMNYCRQVFQVRL